MMKRIVAVILFSMLAVGVVCAETPAFRMSAGGGVMLNTGFGGGVEVLGMRMELGAPLVGFGAFGFFDATFIEADFGFSVGSAKLKVPALLKSYGLNDVTGTLTSLHFTLLGKYPFQFGKFSVFPLFGIEYQAGIAGSGDLFSDGLKAGDMSAFWFKGGIGGDYTLTDKLYIRGELLYGIRFANKAEKDMKDAIAGFGATTKLGHGIGIKAAVGYMF